MRLFTRTVHLMGPPAEVGAYALEIHSHVSQALGTDIGLWRVDFGEPVGTMVFSTRVEGLAQLQSQQATLAADAAYLELVGKGAQYQSAPAEDALGDALHGGDGDMPPAGAVAQVTTAVIAGGAFAEAVAWGIDMAIHAEKVTDSPVGFYMDAFGTFGTVRWIGGAPDMQTAEEQQQALNTDTAYLEKLGSVGNLFVDASGGQVLATRIA